MPGVGDNSLADDALEATVERIEKLIEDRKAINDDIKDVLTVAESKGLDKRTIREMIKLRGLDKEERDEREMLRDRYAMKLGLI